MLHAFINDKTQFMDHNLNSLVDEFPSSTILTMVSMAESNAILRFKVCVLVE